MPESKQNTTSSKRKKRVLIIGSILLLLVIGALILIIHIKNSPVNPKGTPDSGQPSDGYIKKLEEDFEGEKFVGYADPTGIPTIGVGHTGPEVYVGMVIDQAQVDAYLKADLQSANRIVNTIVKVPIDQNQRDGLVDFIFNTGATNSDLFKYVNSGDWQGASDFMKNHYNTAGGVRLPGLISRREWDAADLLA